MKNIKQLGITSLFVGIAIVALKVFADPPTPVISIAPLGTNQFTISITNGVNTANYDLYWTPVLASPAYPWTVKTLGSTGQTNFTVNMQAYSTAFFKVALEGTNSVQPWDAADPNNLSAGILAVFIDTPTNGAVLQ